jgi:hypothetical protein
MKRLVLLSMVALMLASTVFAPVAVAQEPGDVDIQSVTLGPEGTAIVHGTIECTEGLQYVVTADLRQTTGNRPYNTGGGSYPDTGQFTTCQTHGPEPFTITVIGQKPFKKGDVLVSYRAIFPTDEFGNCCIFGPPTHETLRIR